MTMQNNLDKKMQRIGIYGFILNREMKTLLVKRAPQDTNPNLWELPGGGLNHGEDPEDGVIREVKEEVNLAIKVYYPLTARSKISDKDPNKHTIRIAYFCRLLEQRSAVTLSTEHSDFRWVALNESLPFPVSELVRSCIKIITENPQLITVK